MTVIRYGVCPYCGAITSKRETTGTSGVTQSIDYVKGEKCKDGCVVRKPDQKPEVYREKR